MSKRVSPLQKYSVAGSPFTLLSFIKRLVEGYIRCLLCCLFSGTQTVRELGEGCILRAGDFQEQAH